MTLRKLILFVVVINIIIFTFITTVNIPIIDDFWVLHNVNQITHATTFSNKLTLLFEPHCMGFGNAFYNQTEHRYVIMKLLMLLQLKLFHSINLRFFTIASGICLISSLYFLIKFIQKNTNYNNDIILVISILYLTPLYYMNLFWMLCFNNHLTILLGFSGLYFFSLQNNKAFYLGCFALILSLFASHGGIIFIVIAGIYLLLSRIGRYIYMYITIFSILLFLDIYTLSLYYIPNSETTKLGLKTIFSIFPFALLLGSIAINLKLALLIGFIFILMQFYLIKKKYYLKNPEVFCIQLYICATCLGLAVSRWQFGANYFLNTRYKYFSMLIILTFLLAFYEYYFSSFIKYKNILFAFVILYFLGGNIMAYKLAFKRKEIIITGFNFYLKNKVGGLYVFEQNMYDKNNLQNIQAANIMDSLIIDKLIVQ